MSSKPTKSLEEWINFLDSKGQLVRNDREVETRNEISAISKMTAKTQGSAVLHTNISGYPGWRIFHDGFLTRERIGWGFDVDPDNIIPELIEKLKNAKPIKPKEVETGPVKEVKVIGDEVDLTYMPFVFTDQNEGPPFITAGISNIKDPETGWTNTGIRRFQFKGKQKLNNLILPFQHEGMIFSKYMKNNEPAPIAITIGADPTFYLSSLLPADPQVDEMDMWGALTGEPLEVVRCETNDILVPAHAEIIIEGVMDPQERILEGPFSEYTGYNSVLRRCPVIRVTAVTMRKNPIYYYMYNGSPLSEGLSIGVTINEMGLYRQIKALVPDIVDISLLSVWGGITAISISKSGKKRIPGLGKKAAFALKVIKAGAFAKNVILVDEDVDVHDPNQVLWAMSLRFQGSKDITVVPGFTGNFLDPSELWGGYGTGYNAFTILDCTEKMPPYDMPYRRGLAQPAEDVFQRISNEWGPEGFLKEG
jgi:2,5-furandicarboxylate decarboxylase 1